MSGAAMIVSASAASATDRVRQPTCASVPSGAGGHAGDEYVVFDASRHAIEESPGRASHPASLGVLRASEGGVAIHPAIGVHNAVVPIDLIEHGTKQLERRDLFASIASEQFGNRQEGDGILWRFGYDARSSVRIRSYPTNSTMWPRALRAWK